MHDNNIRILRSGDPDYDRPILTDDDLVEQGIGTHRQIARWSREGKLARYRLGNSVRFAQADVDEFIQASRIPAGGAA